MRSGWACENMHADQRASTERGSFHSRSQSRFALVGRCVVVRQANIKRELVANGPVVMSFEPKEDSFGARDALGPYPGSELGCSNAASTPVLGPASVARVSHFQPSCARPPNSLGQPPPDCGRRSRKGRPKGCCALRVSFSAVVCEAVASHWHEIEVAVRAGPVLNGRGNLMDVWHGGRESRRSPACSFGHRFDTISAAAHDASVCVCWRLRVGHLPSPFSETDDRIVRRLSAPHQRTLWAARRARERVINEASHLHAICHCRADHILPKFAFGEGRFRETCSSAIVLGATWCHRYGAAGTAGAAHRGSLCCTGHLWRPPSVASSGHDYTREPNVPSCRLGLRHACNTFAGGNPWLCEVAGR